MERKRQLKVGMIKGIFLAALLCALQAVCPALAAEQPFRRYTSDYFGTVSMLCLYTENGAEEIWSEVKNLLRIIDENVSVSRPDSDIARFNALPAGGSVRVSDMTAEIWHTAEEAHALTGGLYDPTVYPLVDLWGFSPRFNRNTYAPVMPYDRPLEDGHPAPPREGDAEALLPLVGMEGIELIREADGWILRKNTPSVRMGDTEIPAQADLGGMAKGYACDRVAALMREKGITEGYFICGGSSMTFLSRPDGEAFVVTVGKPRPGRSAGEDYASFSVRETTLSTSSDVSHGYRGTDGTLYCHIIDPRTGHPVNPPDGRGIQAGAASVTLTCESAAAGDALSTALMLMGPREGLAFLEGREEKMIMAVWRTGEEELEVVSNLDSEEMTLTDEGYRRAWEQDEDGSFRYTGSYMAEEPPALQTGR